MPAILAPEAAAGPAPSPELEVIPVSVLDDLIPGEEVVFSTEKHWIAPVRTSLTAILLVLGAFVLGMLLPDTEEGLLGFVRNLLELARTALLVAGIGWIIYNVIVWRTATFVVTSRRVLREEGLASRRSSATMLSSVSDVQSRVSFLGARLGYGDLVILTQSGEAGMDRFTTIANPRAFRDKMMAAKDGHDDRVLAAASTATPVVAPAVPVAAAPSAPDPMQTLRQLAELRDSGAVTVEEYEAKKAQILSRI